MKRRSLRITLTATLLGLMLLPLGAAPAAAVPTGCWTNDGVWFPYATAQCSGGTGWYQVWAACKQNFWPYNAAFVESDWKAAGSQETAWVWCPTGYRVLNYGVGLRS
jgi:hypothetical protein